MLRPAGFTGHAAAVEHLHDGHPAVAANGAGHRPPGVNLALGEEPGLAGVALGAFIVGHDGLAENQADAVFGPPH